VLYVLFSFLSGRINILDSDYDTDLLQVATMCEEGS
jgi:hypothetical protein